MNGRAWTWTGVAVIWVSVIAINILMTQYGAPQQVWLFCQIMNWCHR